jgi:hypothetical protein
VERLRNGLEHVRRVAQLPGGVQAAQLFGCRHEQAVVGTDVDPTAGVAERERPPTGADARVDDREVHAGRHVRQRVGQDERSLQDRLGLDPVRDVDDPRLGAMRAITPQDARRSRRGDRSRRET